MAGVAAVTGGMEGRLLSSSAPRAPGHSRRFFLCRNHHPRERQTPLPWWKPTCRKGSTGWRERSKQQLFSGRLVLCPKEEGLHQAELRLESRRERPPATPLLHRSEARRELSSRTQNANAGVVPGSARIYPDTVHPCEGTGALTNPSPLPPSTREKRTCAVHRETRRTSPLQPTLGFPTPGSPTSVAWPTAVWKVP